MQDFGDLEKVKNELVFWNGNRPTETISKDQTSRQWQNRPVHGCTALVKPYLGKSVTPEFPKRKISEELQDDTDSFPDRVLR